MTFEVETYGMTDLGYKIFLDRYALKKLDVQSLKSDRLVLVKINDSGHKELAKVLCTSDVGESADLILGDGTEIYDIPLDQIDVPVEYNPKQMFCRVADAVALAEKEDIRDEWAVKFRDMLDDWKFVPAGRILASAGAGDGVTYYNCYVIPSPVDSKAGILQTLEKMSYIMSSGGGVGINISTIRPKYGRTYSTNGRSSGAVSWGELYSFVTGLIEQGGSRRGALMIILDVTHPDIEEFIEVKKDMSRYNNANISIGITDTFMDAVRNDDNWDLVFPDTTDKYYDELWNGDIEEWENSSGKEFTDEKGCIIKHKASTKVHKTVKAKDLWDKIIDAAWSSAEPGLWFKDKSNKESNSQYFNTLVSTNPCITGDSMIAVADGRGSVSIKELAEIGRTFPVYCYNGNVIDVSLGYDARKTGIKEVFKVILDDGSFIRATKNHRFMLRDGSECELKNLHLGDSLMPMNKRIDGKGYVRVKDNSGMEMFEHRLFLSCKLGRELLPYPEEVTHHVNENKLDNSWDNLEATSHSAHNSDHVLGDNNPMRKWWDGASEEERQVYRENMSASTSGSSNGNSLRSKIFKQARWIWNKGYAIDPATWDSYKNEFCEDTGMKTYVLFHVVKKHVTHEEIFEEIKVSNHKVMEIVHDGVEDVYNLTVYKYHNYAVLTSELSGIIVRNCGEQPLPANGVCLLGSLNLSKFIGNNHSRVVFYYESLREIIKTAVRFLDDVIDVTPYQYDTNEKQQKSERRIGLGTMGLAEVLLELGLKYGSPESLEFIDDLYKFIAETAYNASIDLAMEKGSFPEYDREFIKTPFVNGLDDRILSRIHSYGIRNVTILSQAPTGTIGTMVDTSTGIEPYYAWEYERTTRLGSYKQRVKPYEELVKDLDNSANIMKLPDHFVISMEISPEDHVKVLATVQRWMDSAVSKTCNLPNEATRNDISKIYTMMYELGCKGGTVYRDGSRDVQVLNTETKENNEDSILDRDSLSDGFVKGDSYVDNFDLPKDSPVMERDKILNGKTFKIRNSFGNCFVTINSDKDGHPFEVFVNVGKAGSDIQADAEAIGRLISLILRLSGGVSPSDKLQEIYKQLRGIGSGKSFGFGSDRVSSIPDSIGKALEMSYFEKETELELNLKEELEEIINVLEHEDELENWFPAHQKEEFSGLDETVTTGFQEEKETLGDACPECGNFTFIRSEGCKKCESCGHSEC